VALLGVLSVLLAVAGIGLVLEAVGPHVHRTNSRVAHVAGGLFAIGLTVAAGRWAMLIEHRLRESDRAASSWHVQPGTAPTRRAALRRRHYGPIATGFLTVWFVVLTVGCVAEAVFHHSQAVRSSYVQHHGIRATATVVVVGEKHHCGAHACTYTSEILVRFSKPLHGAKGAFVFYPAYSHLSPGQQLTVLVDPKQPTYAEIPGVGFEKRGAWIAYAVLAPLFAALAWFEGRAFKRVLAHRRLTAVRSVS
jgi:hypothetical protein